MLLIIVFFVIIAFLLAAYIVLNVELDIDELICKIIFAGIFVYFVLRKKLTIRIPSFIIRGIRRKKF